MRHGQQQREQEVHEHLHEQRAVDHALGGAQLAQQAVALCVVGRVGELLDGQDGRAGDDQHETEVDGQVRHDGGKADALVEDIGTRHGQRDGPGVGIVGLRHGVHHLAERRLVRIACTLHVEDGLQDARTLRHRLVGHHERAGVHGERRGLQAIIAELDHAHSASAHGQLGAAFHHIAVEPARDVGVAIDRALPRSQFERGLARQRKRIVDLRQRRHVHRVHAVAAVDGRARVISQHQAARALHVVHHQAVGRVNQQIDLSRTGHDRVIVACPHCSHARAQPGNHIVALLLGELAECPQVRCLEARLGVVGAEGGGHAGAVVGAPVQRAVDGVADADAAAHAGDGQEQHDAHHRQRRERGVHLSVQLPQREHVEPAQVQRACKLHELQQKARQRIEEQHRAHAHEHRGRGEFRRRLHEPVVDEQLVRYADQHDRHREQHERQRQALELHLLVPAACVEQVDELRPCHRARVQQSGNQEDGREHDGGLRQRVGREHEREPAGSRHVGLEQRACELQQKLREPHAHRKAHRERRRAHDERFKRHDPHHVACAHTQCQVHPELALAPLDEESVRVHHQEHEHERDEHRHAADHHAQKIEHLVLRLGEREHALLGRHGIECVEHGHAQHDREEVDAEVREGLAHVAEREPSKHGAPPRLRQARHRPRRPWSTPSPRSCGRTPRGRRPIGAARRTGRRP